MELYLLRHGHAYANQYGLVTGTPQDCLTELGKTQVHQATNLLELYDVTFTHVFVSAWKRAQETAAIFLPEKNFTVDQRLGETQAGEAADMTLEDFKQRYPNFWTAFNPSRSYPRGESHQQLFDRVTSWFTESAAALPSDARILAVTHAGPICCLMQYVCHVDMRYFPVFRAGHASLSMLRRDSDGVWRVALFSMLPPGGERQ